MVRVRKHALQKIDQLVLMATDQDRNGLMVCE